MVALDPPKGVPRNRALGWAVDEAAALNLQVVNGGGVAPFDRPYWRELRVSAAERGVEIEPWVRSPFDLVGRGAAAARSAMVTGIRAAKELGGPVLRTGYGDQKIRKSRYGTDDVITHIKFLTSNLAEAAKIAESEGVILAVENHTDFTGLEWAEVLKRVDSPQVRAAFDTANGMTIFRDPLDDANAVAQWTLTTHVKDLRVVENPQGRYSRVPFTLVGCPLGEGHISILPILRRLVSESPLQSRLPLVLEPGWAVIGPGETVSEVRRRMLRRSLRNLKRMLTQL